MKQTIKVSLCALCLFALALSLVSCFNTVDKVGAWESAIHRKDMELGEGSKTVMVEVKAEEKPAIEPKEKKIVGWSCKICGYYYEGETLPEDFICPLCKHPASDFEPIYG